MTSPAIHVYFFYLRIESRMCLNSMCSKIDLLWYFLLDQMNNVALDTSGIKTNGNVKVCTTTAIAKQIMYISYKIQWTYPKVYFCDIFKFFDKNYKYEKKSKLLGAKLFFFPVKLFVKITCKFLVIVLCVLA